jgi:hypothetical protein
VQRRFVFVFGKGVGTRPFALLALAIHLFKNALAGQLGCAPTLTEPYPRVFSE